MVTNLRPFLCWTTDLRASIVEALTARGAAERSVADDFTGTVFAVLASGDEHHRALFAGGTSLLALDCEAIEVVAGIADVRALPSDDDIVVVDDQTGRPVSLAGTLAVDADGWLFRASLA